MFFFPSREMPTKTEFQETLDSAWEDTLPGQTSVPLTDLKSMLDQVGLRLPKYKVRDLLEELKENNKTDGNNLSKSEFQKVSQVLLFKF